MGQAGRKGRGSEGLKSLGESMLSPFCVHTPGLSLRPSSPVQSAGGADAFGAICPSVGWPLTASAPAPCGVGSLHQFAALTVAGTKVHSAHYMGSAVHRCQPGCS